MNKTKKIMLNFVLPAASLLMLNSCDHVSRSEFNDLKNRVELLEGQGKPENQTQSANQPANTAAAKNNVSPTIVNPGYNDGSWCEYDFSQKGRQYFNGQEVYYSDTNWKPDVEKFVQSVNKDFTLVAIMARNVEKYDYNKYPWGTVLPAGLRADKKSAYGEGCLVVQYKGQTYALPALSLGDPWHTAAGCSQFCAIFFASRVDGSSDSQAAVRAALEQIVSQNARTGK